MKRKKKPFWRVSLFSSRKVWIRLLVVGLSQRKESGCWSLKAEAEGSQKGQETRGAGMNFEGFEYFAIFAVVLMFQVHLLIFWPICSEDGFNDLGWWSPLWNFREVLFSKTLSVLSTLLLDCVWESWFCNYSSSSHRPSEPFHWIQLVKWRVSAVSLCYKTRAS